MCVYCNIRKSAMNRHRERLFGTDAVLRVYTTTPEAGETLFASFTADWFAHRTAPITDGTSAPDSGAWQFQIENIDPEDPDDPIDLDAIVAVTVGSSDEDLTPGDKLPRWRVTKAERPVFGHANIWKLRAELTKEFVVVLEEEPGP